MHGQDCLGTPGLVLLRDEEPTALRMIQERGLPRARRIQTQHSLRAERVAVLLVQLFILCPGKIALFWTTPGKPESVISTIMNTRLAVLHLGSCDFNITLNF